MWLLNTIDRCVRACALVAIGLLVLVQVLPSRIAANGLLASESFAGESRPLRSIALTSLVNALRLFVAVFSCPRPRESMMRY